MAHRLHVRNWNEPYRISLVDGESGRNGMSYTPGPGDLMPPYAGHPHDPRTPDDDDVSDVDACQELVVRIENYLEFARTALFRRDFDKYQWAINKVGELARFW